MGLKRPLRALCIAVDFHPCSVFFQVNREPPMTAPFCRLPYHGHVSLHHHPFKGLSGVRIMRKREINESGEKATGAGIIFGKRKGVIRHLRAL